VTVLQGIVTTQCSEVSIPDNAFWATRLGVFGEFCLRFRGMSGPPDVDLSWETSIGEFCLIERSGMWPTPRRVSEGIFASFIRIHGWLS
jgi:hypothetical protein